MAFVFDGAQGTGFSLGETVARFVVFADLAMSFLPRELLVGWPATEHDFV
jgi:hypothetical protein